MSDSGAHILVFPYPAQGHMIPLLDFTHHLATTRRLNFTITILVTPKNLPLLRPLLSLHPSITPLVLPFPPHPSIPLGVENTVDLPAGGFLSMMIALSTLRDPLLHWFRSHPSPPTAIISDMFLGWTHQLAGELNIRRYAFFPSGAFAISFVNCLWLHMPQRKNNSDENEMIGFSEIPNSPFYPWWQLSPIYRSYVKGDPNSEFIRDTFLSNIASHGLVFNTFSELEGVYLDYLAKELGHNRVWPVGPLLPPNSTERGGSSSIMVHEISSWLDECEGHSVVYVCFGSQAVLTNKQMEELTLGLEKSGVKFILSYKGATKGHVGGDRYGSIPDGFEARVAGTGVVIKGWAPQVLILEHKSVCAFLTHCGWNSTLESIVAGVPMLAWPMGADQFVNATLLVDQLGVAVRVCEGAETVLESDELSRFLVEATGEKWAERRARARELSKAAFDAIREGGSSVNGLDGFTKDLLEKGLM
ncbi:hypothetical protein ACJIZ3_022972 [Penstemon smallii]|uniref:Glycosyltransferase n=1 Tax=Penstemon smallii TaxID=265156 RepID=A0ABD3TP41_9LAMI